MVVKALELACTQVTSQSYPRNDTLSGAMYQGFQDNVNALGENAFIFDENDFKKAKYLNDYFLKFLLYYCDYRFDATSTIENIVENLTN